MATIRRRRNQRRPLTAEQASLAERFIPMARSLAKPYKQAWPSQWEEFDSAAMLAIVEAAESFEAGRNVLFSTFARLRITGALRDVQRQMQRHIAAKNLSGKKVRTQDVKGERFGCSAQELDPYIDGNSDEFVARAPRVVEETGTYVSITRDPPIGTAQEIRDAVEALLRKVPPKHAAALRAIYLDGCSQVEAAARLACSQSRLSFMHKEALAMLREELGRQPEYQHFLESPACS